MSCSATCCEREPDPLFQRMCSNGLQSVQPFIDVERPLQDADYERAAACGCRVHLAALSKVVYGHRVSERDQLGNSCITLALGRLFLTHPERCGQDQPLARVTRKQLRREELQPLTNQVQIMYGASLYELMQLAQRLNSSYASTMRVVQCEMARMRGLCNQHPALATPRQMLLAQLQYQLQEARRLNEHSKQSHPDEMHDSKQLEPNPSNPSTATTPLNHTSSINLKERATGSAKPWRYRDQRHLRRKERRHVLFEKLRWEKRLLEQDDSLVEQALTPLEATLLTYALIDQMVRDKVFVPWERLTPALLVDDLQILLSSLESWKRHASGDALLSSSHRSNSATRDEPLCVEMQRVRRAIEVLERERGDMHTALQIATAAAWKTTPSSPPDLNASPNSSLSTTTSPTDSTDSDSTYVELSRIKPAPQAHTMASPPPRHWLVPTAPSMPSGSDEWPSFYTQAARHSRHSRHSNMSSNMSTSSYATSMSSMSSIASSVSSLGSHASVDSYTSSASGHSHSLSVHPQIFLSAYPSAYPSLHPTRVLPIAPQAYFLPGVTPSLVR